MLTNNVEPPTQTQRRSFYHALRSPLGCMLASLRFLTIIPVSWGVEKDAEFFQGGLFYFSIIGCLIGLFAAGCYYLLSPYIPAAVMGVIVILLLGGASGFLHYDGLADTWDGFLSSRPKEVMLEIMRDSRIGAMGVIAIVAVMLMKIAALVSLDPKNCIPALILMPVAGRASIVFSMALLPYARKENGLGSLFYSEKCTLAACCALLILFLCGCLLEVKAALIVSATVFLTAILFSWWCKRKIGGATGDTLGAMCEVSETAVIVSLSCLYSM